MINRIRRRSIRNQIIISFDLNIIWTEKEENNQRFDSIDEQWGERERKACQCVQRIEDEEDELTAISSLIASHFDTKEQLRRSRTRHRDGCIDRDNISLNSSRKNLPSSSSSACSSSSSSSRSISISTSTS